MILDKIIVNNITFPGKYEYMGNNTTINLSKINSAHCPFIVITFDSCDDIFVRDTISNKYYDPTFEEMIHIFPFEWLGYFSEDTCTLLNYIIRNNQKNVLFYPLLKLGKFGIDDINDHSIQINGNFKNMRVYFKRENKFMKHNVAMYENEKITKIYGSTYNLPKSCDIVDKLLIHISFDFKDPHIYKKIKYVDLEIGGARILRIPTKFIDYWLNITYNVSINDLWSHNGHEYKLIIPIDLRSMFNFIIPLHTIPFHDVKICFDETYIDMRYIKRHCIKDEYDVTLLKELWIYISQYLEIYDLINLVSSSNSLYSILRPILEPKISEHICKLNNTKICCQLSITKMFLKMESEERSRWENSYEINQIKHYGKKYFKTDSSIAKIIPGNFHIVYIVILTNMNIISINYDITNNPSVQSYKYVPNNNLFVINGTVDEFTVVFDENINNNNLDIYLIHGNTLIVKNGMAYTKYHF